MLLGRWANLWFLVLQSCLLMQVAAGMFVTGCCHSCSIVFSRNRLDQMGSIDIRKSHFVLTNQEQNFMSGTKTNGYCRWVRPGPPYVPQQVVDFFRRVLGFVPLIMWGIWYSAVPHKVCTSAWVMHS